MWHYRLASSSRDRRRLVRQQSPCACRPAHADGWSIEVLVRELASLYRQHLGLPTTPLPALPIQYADYAAWQREWLQAGALRSQLTYWQQQLAQLPSSSTLPGDRPRPAVPSYAGALLAYELPPSLLGALQQLCAQTGTTLFMTLLAAFQTVLYRTTSQSDLVVGAPIAGRTLVESEQVVGLFINTLLLRVDLSGKPSLRELLRRARLVLVGRSSLPKSADWEAWLAAHDAQNETSYRIRKVRMLEELGAEVLVAQADVICLEQMRDVVAQACERFGAIHGVIHAAGLSGDGISS